MVHSFAFRYRVFLGGVSAHRPLGLVNGAEQTFPEEEI